MNNRTTVPVWVALLSTIVLLPACGQASATAAAQVYRIPSSIRSVAALSGQLPSMTPGRVERIVDGDTVVVSFDAGTGLGLREKLRLIGVDTPETVDPRRPVERFGAEASRFAEERLAGRNVMLAFGSDLRDRYGRLLAYVFLEDGSCFNLTIVSDGYGFAYTRYPFAFMDDFRKAEREARAAKRGLWR